MDAEEIYRILESQVPLGKVTTYKALAEAVGYWVLQMAQDEDQKIEDRKEEQRREQFEYLMKHAVGWTPPQTGWIRKRGR